ncbi:MAG: S-layer homology domain-containing protein, partial [Bacillota bacterium]|nr:S-layer homology domain-containing protein [Bacillota bacterium]
EQHSWYPAAEEEGKTCRLYYARQANGIPFEDNGISVSLNLTTGEVVDLYCTWYDKAEFPGVEDVMGQEEIFAAMAEQGEFALSYILTGPEEAALVWSFLDATAGAIFDPYTVQRLNYDGTVYTEDLLPAYPDLEGHWSQALVQELLANGYYISGGEDENFYPNAAVTQKEFLRYLMGRTMSYAGDEDFYEYLDREGILPAAEAAPEQVVTRQEAARYIIRFMGLEKAAVHPEIYQHLFADHVAPEYVGYASICQALGIIQGSGDNRFNGQSTMTRAQAAAAIYKTLQAQ